MKRLFKSQLTYLCLAITLNIVCVLILCFVTSNKISYPEPYIIDSSNNTQVADTILSRAYKVSRGNVESFEFFDSSIEASDKMNCKYVLDECNVSTFDEVKKDDVIGKYQGENVIALDDGYCIGSTRENNLYNVDIYYYNKFYVTVSLNSNDYLNNKFQEDEDYYLVVGTKKYDAKFKEYDLSHFYNENKIYARFSLETCTDLLNSYTKCQIARVSQTVQNCFYIDAKAVNNEICSKIFKTIENGQYKDVTIPISNIVGDKAIIALNNLYDGMILYE